MNTRDPAELIREGRKAQLEPRALPEVYSTNAVSNRPRDGRVSCLSTPPNTSPCMHLRAGQAFNAKLTTMRGSTTKARTRTTAKHGTRACRRPSPLAKNTADTRSKLRNMTTTGRAQGALGARIFSVLELTKLSTIPHRPTSSLLAYETNTHTVLETFARPLLDRPPCCRGDQTLPAHHLTKPTHEKRPSLQPPDTGIPGSLRKGYTLNTSIPETRNACITRISHRSNIYSRPQRHLSSKEKNTHIQNANT